MSLINRKMLRDFSVPEKDIEDAIRKKKKVIRKLSIAFFIFLLLSFFTYYFISNEGGKFTSFNSKMGFVIFLILSFITTFVLLSVHLNLNFSLKHYSKYYSFYDMIQFIVVVLSIIIFAQIFIFKIALISGSSMEPTLKNNDQVFLLQAVNKYNKDDIVVMDASYYINRNLSSNIIIGRDKNAIFYIKRIKALPGDVLSLKETEIDGRYEVLVNDTPLKDSYDQTIIVYEDTEHYKNLNKLSGTLPEDYYFLLGDNINNSKDSRSFGFVYKKDLVGKVNFRLWGKFGRIK